MIKENDATISPILPMWQTRSHFAEGLVASLPGTPSKFQSDLFIDCFVRLKKQMVDDDVLPGAAGKPRWPRALGGLM